MTIRARTRWLAAILRWLTGCNVQKGDDVTVRW